MLYSAEDFMEQHRGDNYAELINIRAELMSEIVQYENKQKNGECSEKEEMGMLADYKIYEMKLNQLSTVIRLMAEKYDKDIDMVDPYNEIEVSNFYHNVLWPKQVGFVSNKKVTYAIKLINRLAKQGDADAMNAKGNLYFEGDYVPQDYKKAVFWYRKAASMGHGLAMSNLGYAFFYGDGVKQNYAKAYKYLSMAMLRDEPDAFIKLGDMYKEGIYLLKDNEMAMQCYVRANKIASQIEISDAYPASLVRIAEYMFSNENEAPDYVRARYLLEEAKDILLNTVLGKRIYNENLYERVCMDLEKLEML